MTYQARNGVLLGEGYFRDTVKQWGEGVPELQGVLANFLEPQRIYAVFKLMGKSPLTILYDTPTETALHWLDHHNERKAKHLSPKQEEDLEQIFQQLSKPHITDVWHRPQEDAVALHVLLKRVKIYLEWRHYKTWNGYRLKDVPQFVQDWLELRTIKASLWIIENGKALDLNTSLPELPEFPQHRDPENAARKSADTLEALWGLRSKVEARKAWNVRAQELVLYWQHHKITHASGWYQLPDDAEIPVWVSQTFEAHRRLWLVMESVYLNKLMRLYKLDGLEGRSTFFGQVQDALLAEPTLHSTKDAAMQDIITWLEETSSTDVYGQWFRNYLAQHPNISLEQLLSDEARADLERFKTLQEMKHKKGSG